jgi:hypothetical protein
MQRENLRVWAYKATEGTLARVSTCTHARVFPLPLLRESALERERGER